MGDVAVDADAGVEVALPGSERVDDRVDHGHEGEHIPGPVVPDHALRIARAVDEHRGQPSGPQQLGQGDPGDSGSDDEDARRAERHGSELSAHARWDDHLLALLTPSTPRPPLWTGRPTHGSTHWTIQSTLVLQLLDCDCVR